MLSTTSPLIQAWFARRYPRPQSLSAVRAVESGVDAGARWAIRSCSSPGSPRERRRGDGPPAMCCSSACARRPHAQSRQRTAAPAASAQREPADGECATAPRRDLPRQLLWCALAATSSVLLLAVTNHITQNIAAVPLLWIVPLSLYLSVHPLFRRQGLVSPRDLPRDARRGARRHGLDAGRPEADARACAADRRLLRRILPGLHVLPWRARDAQAGAALPHALLPDDLARRRAGFDRRRASSRRSCSPPTSTSPSRSSRARCCCCGRRGGRRSCFRRWLSLSLLFTDRLRHLERRRVLQGHGVTSRNFYGGLRVQDSGARTSTAAAR